MSDQFNQVPQSVKTAETRKIATTTWVEDLLGRSGDGPTFGEQSIHPPRQHRVFICKITGNETGSEKYTCAVYTCKLGLNDPTAAVANADIEGETVFGNAVYVNLQGNNSATHTLTDADNTNQKYFVGHFNGYTSESTPRAVFVGNALWAFTCP